MEPSPEWRLVRVPVPPVLCEALGCNSHLPQAALFAHDTGDYLEISDGCGTARADSDAFRLWAAHPAVGLTKMMRRVLHGAGGPPLALLIDRDAAVLWIGPRDSIRHALREAALLALDPENECVEPAKQEAMLTEAGKGWTEANRPLTLARAARHAAIMSHLRVLLDTEVSGGA